MEIGDVVKVRLGKELVRGPIARIGETVSYVLLDGAVKKVENDNIINFMPPEKSEENTL
jgi:hypothetical protein